MRILLYTTIVPFYCPYGNSTYSNLKKWLCLKFDRIDIMTQKEHTPAISVIMPVYNAERFLHESIDSILRQTLADFEFIIINDGSTDGSQRIIDTYAKQDSRIISIRQENSGVVATANKAIQLSKGKYIARMDADDISMPDRLRQEAAILDAQPKTVLVCSSFEIIDQNSEFQYKDIVAPGNDHIKRTLYLRNPIANGSTLIRKDSLVDVGLFDNVFAEDLKMWTKLAAIGDFESTGSVLYRWRMNPTGLTLSNNELSMSKGEEYIASLWSTEKPKMVSRKEILKASKHYLGLKSDKNIEYRQIYLTDISQLAAKFFTNGYRTEGLRQLAILSLSSGDGFKAAVRRIKFIAFGHYGKVRRRLSSDRTPFDNAD